MLSFLLRMVPKFPCYHPHLKSRCLSKLAWTFPKYFLLSKANLVKMYFFYLFCSMPFFFIVFRLPSKLDLKLFIIWSPYEFLLMNKLLPYSNFLRKKQMINEKKEYFLWHCGKNAGPLTFCRSLLLLTYASQKKKVIPLLLIVIPARDETWRMVCKSWYSDRVLLSCDNESEAAGSIPQVLIRSTLFSRQGLVL